MYNPQDSGLKKFLKSPHHLWLLGLTIGVGFLSAQPLIFLAGVGLYAVGCLHLPDMAIYRNWVQKNEDRIAAAQLQKEVTAFKERRQALIAGLTYERKNRYIHVAAICEDIERATQDGGTGADVDPRVRKLDELMWTYLRLLVMEGSLHDFLVTEDVEKVPAEIKTSQSEVSGLEAEIKTATGKGETPAAKLRLLDSKKERLAALSRRQERITEAQENATLVTAEQDRLVEQIKLLRADAIAARNADTLSARIDATVEHLTETNKLFSEMDQFKDLVADDMPQTGERLGYSADTLVPAAVTEAVQPPLIPSRRQGTRQ